MCGINGIMQFHRNMTRERMESIVAGMNAAIVHRGPDDDGVFSDDRVSLGMRRLAIIDLVTGKQPMSNEDGSLVIVFNGEIYNYRELKRILLGKGHVFATGSDTEVVLHAYEEYGMDFLRRFDGMFAFALYDLRKQELLICRDRAGEKPLYYRKTEEGFLFGSELKSLLRTGLVKGTIDLQALCLYLQLTYIPAPFSIIENVRKLPAAHYMRVTSGGSLEIHPYWDLVYDPKAEIDDYGECRRLLREALYSSVERRMISDVPIGAFLSGGIDSTIVTGIMAGLSSRPVETFTIGFHDRRYDESARAGIASEFHHTHHHVHFLDHEEARDGLAGILGFLDEPFADPSALPTFLVSKFARKFVKVVLTGDGGDELFAGYDRYSIGYYSRAYNAIPEFLRRHLIERMVFRLPDGSNVSRKARKVIRHSGKAIREQRMGLIALGMDPAELRCVMKPFDPAAGALGFIAEYYNKYSGADELSRTLYTDFKVSLEGDMLAKVDRMGMANSLETRLPLLGGDVIDAAVKIPAKYKMSHRRRKIILKETFSDLIPPRLRSASKRGFRVPIGEWLRGPWKGLVETSLDRDVIESQGLFDSSFVGRLIEEHMTKRIDRSNPLWSLIVFQKWRETSLR
ncbi:MAG: amidotransferase 1, exosortase A system-associated [Deltaproteobacteria bacterium]